MTAPHPRRSASASQSSRIEDGDAGELFVRAVPTSVTANPRVQFCSMAESALATLRREGFVAADVAAGWVYMRTTPNWCWRTLLASAWHEHDPERLPFTFLVQPPATANRYCEMHLHAVRPRSGRCSVVWRGSSHAGGPLSTTVLRRGARHLRLFSVTPRLPAGAPFVELAADMFARAQHALTDRGLSFGDVVRTWIYVADMGDYAALNQARNRFFKDSGIDRPPASTGIGGRLAAPPAAVAMDVYAVGGLGEARIETIHAERMGEAAAYGSAFARGVVLGEAGRRVAYLSGTASVDARGRVVAPRDLRGQLRRMFENARDLLAGVGLTPEQVLSATVYLKRPGFLREFRTAARYFGLPVDAPTAVVVAEVCRPAWLCEIELVAGTAGEAGSSRTL